MGGKKVVESVCVMVELNKEKINFKSSLEYTSGQSLISSGLQPQYNHVAHRLMHKIPNILLTQSTNYVYIQ